MKRQKKLTAKSRKTYMEGMKKYQEKGVPVLIDGKEADEALWERIFEVREDGSFYMGDYILEETDGVREDLADYQPERRLKEIRFQKVYNR